MNCYLFYANAGREADWKVASKYCKRSGGFLVEMETIEENQDIISYIQQSSHLKGKFIKYNLNHHHHEKITSQEKISGLAGSILDCFGYGATVEDLLTFQGQITTKIPVPKYSGKADA